ncbi:predicted protein [Chaetomium globosum CBS 148.51]|uniref:Uncharacterized protein n=1 Tax=Chaetomium globosum (strain ATCC 6205 / CBS 148.51 / DSM 1962 / NBRC 6347 / NRRL 1970) TaxID=306901 RepID=Q2HE78_CHAGB|nr:uncharacterized protein CHGG_01476 [Chaetomium globosum CBS 148.51]EAQ93241.1 predicted protein [Chaetomium globosum CBS 148.51]
MYQIGCTGAEDKRPIQRFNIIFVDRRVGMNDSHDSQLATAKAAERTRGQNSTLGYVVQAVLGLRVGWRKKLSGSLSCMLEGFRLTEIPGPSTNPDLVSSNVERRASAMQGRTCRAARAM